MTNGEPGYDRRATGVQKVLVPDGNGGKKEFVQVNVAKATVWMQAIKVFVALVILIAGAMWGAVRFGVSSEVHSEVETAIKAECEHGGMIDVHVTKVAGELVDEFQAIIEDEIVEADRERQEQHDLGIRLEERQIALQQKMAEDKADLIREIQRAGSGGS